MLFVYGCVLRNKQNHLTIWLTPDENLLRFNHMVKSEAHKLDLIFHALSDSTRRAILLDVSKKEKTVSEIAKPHKMSLAAVSKHLKVLESASLIERQKQGSYQMVRLNIEAFKTAEQWMSYYQQFWGPRLDALQDFLEKRKR
jgi:DNA-binding transcriptional ArsR family regulator